MAYVITQACIGVKDTACVDACPTDSIHAYADSPQFYIDPATCIDCNACESACPVKAIFPGDQVPEAMRKFTQMNADFFKAFDKSKSAAYAKQKKSGEKKEEGANASVAEASVQDSNWVEQSGWEVEWQKQKDVQLDRLEEQKRYGRVRAVYEQDDRFVLRFYLPEQMPNHPFRYKFGLGNEMATYNVTAELKNNVVTVRGKIADPKIAKLCGLANSFPDRFFVEYTFPQEVASVSVTMQGKHVADIVAVKKEPSSKAA